MATYTKINDWVKNEGEVADLDNDTFVVALSNVAPASETSNPIQDGNGVLANVTQINYANLSSRTLTLASSGQTGGTYKLDFEDLVLIASGGDVAEFRYLYIYDDTPTAPADPLVCVFDLVTPVILTNGNSRTIQFHANGLYTKG